MPLKCLKLAVMIIAITGFHALANAQEVLTGDFRVTRTSSEVFGAATAEQISSVIALDEKLQWRVFVPETYDQGNPPGLFVFIDENGWGGMPDQYRQLITHRNLIWIGATNIGRGSPEVKKMLLALMAERVIDLGYMVNRNRMYVGSSGADATTAINVMLKSNDFAGAVFIDGSAYWAGGKPPNFELLVNKYYAFIAGASDKSWSGVRRDSASYKKDGIQHVKVLDRPGHLGDWPDVDHIDEALAYLDQR